MTIANEITKLNTNLTASYTACNNKGATMPANQNFDNLATCIGTIQTGSTPTLITKNITANGTYNASSDNADGYSSVTVNVSGGGGTTTYSYPELKGGNYYVLDDETIVPMYFSRCNIGGQTLGGTVVEMQNSIAVIEYNNGWVGRVPITSNSGIVNGSIDVHVKHISLNGFPSSNYKLSIGNTVFNDDSNFKNYLTSVCISSMKNILSLQRAFNGCSYLTEVDVSSIDYLPSRAFYGTTAVGGAFSNTAVQTLSFNSLNSNSFGSYTDQFNNMLRYQTNCTVHFPSNLQSVIGNWSSVTSGFGGTNTTVLFDLPATT